MAEDNWGRWGAEDEFGAQNHLTTERVLEAVQLVKRGEIYRLGQLLGPETPVPDHRKHFERLMMRDGGDYAAGARRPEGFQFAEEVISLAGHTGTHVDALAHAWYDDRLYNGFSSNSIRSTTGALHCGADKLKPMITRGVLLDVSSGSTVLGPGDAISDESLSRAASAAGVSLHPGDVVLVHTGWLNSPQHEMNTYHDGEPGIDISGAKWLAEADVAAVGSDNYAVEVVPFAAGNVFPVHKMLLRDYGIPLLEGLVLADLAEAGVTTFLFVASPLPIVGGTASPICPLAVV